MNILKNDKDYMTINYTNSYLSLSCESIHSNNNNNNISPKILTNMS